MPLNESQLDYLSLFAKTIRGLSIDAIETAGCGHPGLPLGCAELGAYLYGHALRFNPKDTKWMNRDQFVLSAGHGSMLQYACMHLSGYDVSLEDLKNFRQFKSCTAGHPEYGEIPGIETTTGPLGQGFAMSVGMALAQRYYSTQFKLGSLIQSQVVSLVGDGCMMEGVCAEAASLAGHLKLSNLICFYDSNDVCLDGPLSESMTEDTGLRFESYGWSVITIDGHSFEDIDQAYQKALLNQDSPTLIVAKTVIGYGAPHVAGSSESHGKALGSKEALLTKQALGIPESPLFYVDEALRDACDDRLKQRISDYDDWIKRFDQWKQAFPSEAQALDLGIDSHTVQRKLLDLPVAANKATRAMSQMVIQALYDMNQKIIGGSADLSCSDSTAFKQCSFMSSEAYQERNIKYGVREFAMGAICNGLALSGLLPFCGTFLVFSDYMKNAIRLAALMKLSVVYQFTHDSFLLGEDGPTHQPVEHLASLRSIPGLRVIRPADDAEVKGAWVCALSLPGPTALVLSRQSVKTLENTSLEAVSKGAYIVKHEKGEAFDLTLLATGSELQLALEVANVLDLEGYDIRVVSFPSFSLFDAQSDDYKSDILSKKSSFFCSIEAQSSFGWHKYIGSDGLSISMDEFGLSAPQSDLEKHFGFTVDRIVQRVKNMVSLTPNL